MTNNSDSSRILLRDIPRRKILVIAGLRIVVFALLIFLLVSGLMESIDQSRIKDSQRKQEFSINELIRENIANRYTKKDAAIDFELRDGQIYKININIDTLLKLTKDNTNRIEQLEVKTSALNDPVHLR